MGEHVYTYEYAECTFAFDASQDDELTLCPGTRMPRTPRAHEHARTLPCCRSSADRLRIVY